jgi:alpha-tubulin suppressor-like RCC1 family protein
MKQRRSRGLAVITLASALFFGVTLGATSLSTGVAAAQGEPGEGALTGAVSTYVWGHGIYAPAKTDLTGEVAIDAGNGDNLLVEPNGHVWETGPSPTDAKTPYVVPNLSNVVSVADGGRIFMALSSPTRIKPGTCPSSTVWVWSQFQPATEVKALNGLGVTQITEASNHRIAVTCNGSVYVWGTGNQLGMGPNQGAAVSTPELNPYLSALTHGTDSGVSISSGSDMSGMLVHGQAYMWGNNLQGQCGCSLTATFIFYPTAVTQHGVTFQTINAGGDEGNDGQTLAIDPSGNAWCWGANFDGQCGIGTSTNAFAPVKVHVVTSVTKVSAGGDYSLFLTKSGELWGCGTNGKGEVGDNSTANQLTPVHVFSGISDMNAGANHAIAVSNN